MVDRQKHFLFLTDVLKRKVFDADGETVVGTIDDLVASTKELYPRIVSALVHARRGGGRAVIPWNKLEHTAKDIYVLKSDARDYMRPYAFNEGEFLLKDEFLDMQIVDTYGCKVVRVNDLHLLKEKGVLWVVHADVGLRGVIRRLGCESGVDLITDWLFSYKMKDKFISWKFVQGLSEPGKAVSVLKLKVTQEKMSHLWPADIAEMIEDLGVKERMNLFRALDIETAANVVKEVTPHVRRSIFESIGKDRGSQLFKTLSEDEIADIIVDLPQRKADMLLGTLKKEKVETIREIAALPQNEAGSFMELGFVALHQDITLQEGFRKIKETAHHVELIYYVYVIDHEHKLVGVTTMRNMLLHEEHQRIADIMNTNVIKVQVDTDRKEVIRIFVKYDFDVLPVVDEHDKLIGVIALKNAIEKLIPNLVREK
jgi:CBS domain-containing protein